MQKYTFIFLLTIGLIGCKKEIAIKPEDPKTNVPNFSNIVILGNSITQAGPDPSIGWNADWGMAASKPEFDYVHLLTAKFLETNPTCKVNVRNIGAFEVDYINYNYSKHLADLKTLKPDLLIVRIGENVVQDQPQLVQFEAQYNKLIKYFTDNNPNLQILAVGSFWGNPVVDQIMKNRSSYVTLRPLLDDTSNQAWGQYDSHSIQVHPSDKGMQGIYQIIWAGIRKLPVP